MCENMDKLGKTVLNVQIEGDRFWFRAQYGTLKEIPSGYLKQDECNLTFRKYILQKPTR